MFIFNSLFHIYLCWVVNLYCFFSVVQYLQKLKGWRAEMVLINSRIFLDIIFESIPVCGGGGGGSNAVKPCFVSPTNSEK